MEITIFGNFQGKISKRCTNFTSCLGVRNPSYTTEDSYPSHHFTISAYGEWLGYGNKKVCPSSLGPKMLRAKKLKKCEFLKLCEWVAETKGIFLSFTVPSEDSTSSHANNSFPHVLPFLT